MTYRKGSRLEAVEEARRIVSQMTIEEKIEQLNYDSPGIDRLEIKDYNYWSEGLHGVARAGLATMFPQAIGLAAMFDENMMEKIGDTIATEARAKYNAFQAKGDRDIYKGVTYWSPNINIFRDPRWGRGQETYGEDPYLTGKLGVSFIKGLQGDGKYLKLAACAKHFAGHSGPEPDRHHFQEEISQKDLYETYLPAFEMAVKDGKVESVMGAYSGINGIPMCVHGDMINGLLREKWGFEGHFVSDYYALEDVYPNHHYSNSHAETMALALKAGCDLCAGKISPETKEALENKLVTEEDITTAVERLYTTRVMLGMFDKDTDYNQIPYEVVDSYEHRKLAEEASRKSLVLLKNDGILPLDKEEISTIAVIGPNANSRTALIGNYAGTPSRYYTVLEGIQDAVSEKVRVYYSEGCHMYKNNIEGGLAKEHDREKEAEIIAERSDVIVLSLGLDSTMEGEQGDVGNTYASGDLPDLSLPGQQERLLRNMLEIGKPVILIVSAGGGISLNGLESHPNLKGIIHNWYPGNFGGKSLADILFGVHSPSGKLPITFYKEVEKLPDFTDYSMENRTYRYATNNVLYPFGYGLSYSKVMFDDLKLKNVTPEQSLELEVSLHNQGDYPVEETIQVYLQNKKSEYRTKNPRLVIFKKVKLSVGESKTISLVVNWKSLLVVNNDGESILDDQEYEVFVGNSQPDSISKTLLGVSPLSMAINL